MSDDFSYTLLLRSFIFGLTVSMKSTSSLCIYICINRCYPYFFCDLENLGVLWSDRIQFVVTHINVLVVIDANFLGLKRLHFQFSSVF